MKFRNVIRMSEEDWWKLLPDRIQKTLHVGVFLIQAINVILLVLMALTGYQLWKAILVFCVALGTNCFIVGVYITMIFFSMRIETEIIEEVIE